MSMFLAWQTQFYISYLTFFILLDLKDSLPNLLLAFEVQKIYRNYCKEDQYTSRKQYCNSPSTSDCFQSGNEQGNAASKL